LDFVPLHGRVCGGGKRECAAAGWAKNVTQKNNRRGGVDGMYAVFYHSILFILSFICFTL
jgi:hypothetical protein